jgi:hypothetical protein
MLMYTDYVPKRLLIHAHLALDQLETRCRRAKDPVVRRHGQSIWPLAQGLAFAQVAAVTGYTVNWIRTTARRSDHQGPTGLEDRRHRNPRAVRLLSLAQRRALSATLEQPPPDGASGPAAKRPPGWRQRWAAACIPSGGGRCCGARGGLRRCRVPAMAKRTPPHRPPSIKPPGRSGGGATDLSSGGGGAVNDRPTPDRPQAHLTPGLKPSRPAPAGRGAPSLPAEPSRRLCASTLQPDGAAVAASRVDCRVHARPFRTCPGGRRRAGHAGDYGARPRRLARQRPRQCTSRGASALPARAVARIAAGRAPVAADQRAHGQSALPRLSRTACGASATLSPTASDAGVDSGTDKFPLVAAKCLNTR